MGADTYMLLDNRRHNIPVLDEYLKQCGSMVAIESRVPVLYSSAKVSLLNGRIVCSDSSTE